MRKGGTRRAISDDALYYDGIDTTWDSRGAFDHDNHTYAPAYGDDYYVARLNPDEEELLVQRALDRIRIARSRGQPNVNLSHEELGALARPRLQQFSKASDPAPARPSSKGRSSNNTSASSSTRSKKSSSRPSLFSSSPRSSRNRPGKSDSKRRNSPAHDLDVPSAAPPPGFRIPGAGAAPLGYTSRPSSRPESRGASGVYPLNPGRERGDSFIDPAFRDYVQPSSRDSYGLTQAEEAEYLARRANRSRSGSSAAGFPQPPYPTHMYERERGRPSDADPFMYQTGGPPPGLYAGSSASSSPNSQRRAMGIASTGASPSSDGFSYTAMPRRVPVPSSSVPAVGGSRLGGIPGLGRGSISDPALDHRAFNGQNARDFEVEVEYDIPSPSGSSGDSDGAQQGVRIGAADFCARTGVRDRVKELEREANTSGRSGSGNGSGHGRKRKDKRR
ncbi:hypothetical protein MPH_07824 [Macrophomina phaseolina MS6]|uniref:Uncharacterized protein n=1 Tax=Macrophomina phaseolina (strain MS6) TaxID=1126212 RepID=K2RXH7_MACPH|nr:hypothetical protein MPH_07824 [Macrophomina phaseolina MS6]